MSAKLTIGPVLFHWPAEQKRDFYFRIADEAPVDTVCLGEVICSKRAPFFEPHYAEVAERLTSAGKTVVFSTLAETMIKRERKMIAEMCAEVFADGEYLIEANDSAALYHLRGKPHWIGPYINAYNEDTLALLAGYGATHVTLPPEMPAAALRVMGNAARALDISLEVQVYGRVPLALSARCYHARAHDRVKDNCQFVCEQDPDGMDLRTLDGQSFLSINGTQTLSHTCLNLAREMKDIQAMGISAFRLSPHSSDMVETAGIFRTLADDLMSPEDAVEQLGAIGLGVPFSNGFFHKREGYRWVGEPESRAAQPA